MCLFKVHGKVHPEAFLRYLLIFRKKNTKKLVVDKTFRRKVI